MRTVRIIVLMAAWLPAAASLAAHKEPMSAAKLAEQLAGEQMPLVLDVRTEWEYQSGHVPGAVHIPHTELAGRLSDIPAGKQDEIVVYCEQGPRASRAEAMLEDAGYMQTRTLRGHMANWRSEGYPMQR